MRLDEDRIRGQIYAELVGRGIALTDNVKDLVEPMVQELAHIDFLIEGRVREDES